MLQSRCGAVRCGTYPGERSVGVVFRQLLSLVDVETAEDLDDGLVVRLQVGDCGVLHRSSATAQVRPVLTHRGLRKTGGVRFGQT